MAANDTGPLPLLSSFLSATEEEEEEEEEEGKGGGDSSWTVL